VCCDCEVNNTKCSGQVCPAGKYACNRESDNYCCPIGAGGCQCGVKADGTCKPCGGSECWPSTVNCPPGTVKDTTQVVNTQCRRNAAGQNACGPTGTAQTSGGPTSSETGGWCCGGAWKNTDNCWTKPSGKVECEQYWECSNWRIRTYACKSTCNATAPSNVSVSQGSSPSVLKNLEDDCRDPSHSLKVTLIFVCLILDTSVKNISLHKSEEVL
jgi:hypothetical protein